MDLPDHVKALLQPGAYPHPCTKVVCSETHISWVLLTGEYAYKVKKPVDLGFLDFSTLERRRHFCHEELRCNLRFAPELYVDVVAITRTARGFAVEACADAAGEIVDYAVRMRQFPANEQLDRSLDAGRLDGAELEAFADALWAAHARLPQAPPGSNFGTAAAVLAPVEENFKQLHGARDADDFRAALAELARWSLREHAVLAGTFARRQRLGFVRECHGDLHLSNMVRLPEGIRAFDCIEFSETLRWIDVISDAAFLVMDCIVRERRDLAYRFLNRYLEQSGDYAGARLLGFYLVYRSLVRAKVAALQASDASSQDLRAALRARLARHIELSVSRALGSDPMLIVTCGFSGSGKTWLAEQLIPELPAVRIRSDVERKRMFGLEPLARSSSPRHLYGEAQNRRVYRHLADCAASVIGGGDSVIVDAAFLDPDRRDEFAALAARLHVPHVILVAECPQSLLEARIRQREASGLDASEATVDVLHRQLERGLGLRGEEPVLRVDTAEPADVAAVSQALRAIAQRR
jgi:uncharacterized protein